jgi:arsenate reductase
MTLTIYHNPRCSKSRQTLKLIEEAGHEPNIVEYMDNPLSSDEIEILLEMLGAKSAKDILRRNEKEYKELDLKNIDDETSIITAMAAYPRLIERPIVENGERAILGRPPENVKELL